MNTQDKIIDGKALAKKIREQLALEIKETLVDKHIVPTLHIIIVGNKQDSMRYVKNKVKACYEVGVANRVHYLEETVSESEILDIINRINSDEYVHGLLVQLPLPEHIDEKKILNAIDPSIDVDGFHPWNAGLLHLGLDVTGRIPATAQGIIDLIESVDTIAGKKAVVLGRSNIVGRPVARLLEMKDATVTVCHSNTSTSEMVNELRTADIIVSAIGQPKIITRGMIGFNQILIDVGINVDENEKLCGDFDFESVYPMAKYITPVPGGCGPMTIAKLLCNVVENAKRLAK